MEHEVLKDEVQLQPVHHASCSRRVARDHVRGVLQPRVQSNAERVLNTAGDKPIQKIFIKRSPVSKVLTGALSAFSLGKFGKRMYKNYDELFHLYCELVLENGKTILVEKNERIRMQRKDTRYKILGVVWLV